MFQPLMFGDNIQNIYIQGPVKIDGKGIPWRRCLKTNISPCKGYGAPTLIWIHGSRNIFMQDLEILNHPYEAIHISYSILVYLTKMIINSHDGFS